MKKRSFVDRFVKPSINASDQDLQRVTRQAIDALKESNSPPTLFLNGDSLVRLESGENGEPRLRKMTVDRMVNELAKRIDWRQTTRNVEVPAKPPRDVAQNVLATPDLPFPHLDQIVRCPVFAPDGGIQQEPGYCEATRTLYCPAPGLEIPLVSESPTGKELAQAKRIIRTELLGDFPFSGPADRAHALCALLQPFVRPMIDGATPLYLIEKPSPGTGGTLLTDILAFPALGTDPPKITMPGNEGELKRMLFSALRDAPTVLALDNLPETEIKSPSLSSAITSTECADRVVGTSDTLRLPIRCLWIANGNNPNLARDLARRCVFIRIDAAQEAPDQRTGFLHPDLKGWARKNRGDLIWAALTICQAWVAEGMPAGKGTLGMFESWAETMSGILDVAGIPGFLENLHERRAEADYGTEDLTLLVEGWFRKFRDRRVCATQLLPCAEHLDLGSEEQSRRICLGQLLSRNRDKKLDKLFIRRGRSRNGSHTWYLEKDL